VCGDYLISLGFTGKLHSFDRKSGKIIWKKDLVDEHQSVPVQFGFSASPLPLGDRVIVLAGGKGGLLCLDVATGKTIWNYACREASYATPILWKRQNGNQIVFVTRNRMIGVAADDGNPLWEYELPEVGLTNVPTPMVIDNNALLVSGQGIKGTRRISITEEAGEMIANEDWQNDEQFFYCNWIRRDNILWGCDGRLLLAIDLKTGKRLGRFRGFRDANLLQGKTSMLSFDGEGNLTRLAPTENGAKVVAKYSVLEKRCWTPPTPHGGKLYCRGGDQLLCLDLEGGDQRAAVAKSPIRNPMLKLSVGEPIAEKPDPIETIVASFEQGGAEAAWDTYSKLRADDPDNLSFGTRQELAKMADSQGLEKFAKMIRSHMEKDFPDEVKQAKRKPSKDTSIGKNGLVYLEFSIHNTSQETIQAVVKGPEKHPFGYGLPIRPNQPRIEKWPVGTKLYRTHNGIRKEVLLTVEKGFAGRTIELPQQVK
jgi:outer membrane protein assembly factor BamB